MTNRADSADINNVQVKRPYLKAVSLGLLTFIVTPLVSIALGFVLLILGKLSEFFNLITFISYIAGLQGLGGYIAAKLIFIGFFALMGNAVTAIISWLIIRSKLLAGVTFISALGFQILLVFLVVHHVIKTTHVYQEAGGKANKVYQHYAKIGNVRYELQEPYSDHEIDNLVPEYGAIYKRFVLHVPVSISRAGTYRLTVQYRFRTQSLWGSTSIKDITRTLGATDHEIQIVFLANEAGGGYGYWSPEAVGGKAEVQLSYLASKNELVDKLKSGPSVDKAIVKQFLQDEGLNKEHNNSTVNKFIERKIIQF